MPADPAEAPIIVSRSVYEAAREIEEMNARPGAPQGYQDCDIAKDKADDARDAGDEQQAQFWKLVFDFLCNSAMYADSPIRIIEDDKSVDLENIRRIMKAEIEKGGQFFNDTDWQEIERLLKACLLAIDPDPYNQPLDEVKQLISNLTNEYGCWLDWIDIGLDAAVKEIEDPAIRELRGAYQMLKPFLADIYIDQKR